MKYSKVLLFALILFSCTQRSSDTSEEVDNVTEDKSRNYFEEFERVTLPVKYTHRFLSDLGGGGFVPEVKDRDDLFYSEYISQEDIRHMMREYFDKHYPDLPFIEFSEYNHDRTFEIGQLEGIDNSNTNWILLCFTYGDLNWDSDYLFLMKFNENKQLEQVEFVAGQCSKQDEEIAIDSFDYHINGTLSLRNKNQILITREIQQLSVEVDEVVNTFQDSTLIKIK